MKSTPPASIFQQLFPRSYGFENLVSADVSGVNRGVVAPCLHSPCFRVVTYSEARENNVEPFPTIRVCWSADDCHRTGLTLAANAMTVKIVLEAGDVQSGSIDLSWEGQAELELSVAPLIRGTFLHIDIATLNGIAHRTDVTLRIEGLQYVLTSVERSGAFEAIADGA